MTGEGRRIAQGGRFLKGDFRGVDGHAGVAGIVTSPDSWTPTFDEWQAEAVRRVLEGGSTSYEVQQSQCQTMLDDR